MKVYVQVVDTQTSIYQSGMIEERVKQGSEVANALKHFGVIYGEVAWIVNGDTIKVGMVTGTDKIVHVTTV